MAKDKPALVLEVRDIGSKAPMGPWQKRPDGVWIREQPATVEQAISHTAPR